MRRFNIMVLTTTSVLFLALILSVISHTNYITAGAFENLDWDAYRTLNWSDFTGIPDYNDNFVKALTASSIKYSYTCINGQLNYDVNAVFKKDQSWVKEEARTDYHLNHEQLHFDITELYVRKLKNHLKTRSYPCHEVDQFENTVNAYLESWRNEQVLYDKETFFSVIESKQKEWNYKISVQLFDDFLIHHPNYATKQ